MRCFVSLLTLWTTITSCALGGCSWQAIPFEDSNNAAVNEKCYPIGWTEVYGKVQESVYFEEFQKAVVHNTPAEWVACGKTPTYARDRKSGANVQNGVSADKFEDIDIWQDFGSWTAKLRLQHNVCENPVLKLKNRNESFEHVHSDVALEFDALLEQETQHPTGQLIKRADLVQHYAFLAEAWSKHGYEQTLEVFDWAWNRFIRVGPMLHVDCNFNAASPICECSHKGVHPVDKSLHWNDLRSIYDEPWLNAALTYSPEVREYVPWVLQGWNPGRIAELRGRTDGTISASLVYLRRKINATGTVVTSDEYHLISLLWGMSFEDVTLPQTVMVQAESKEVTPKELLLLQRLSLGESLETIQNTYVELKFIDHDLIDIKGKYKLPPGSTISEWMAVMYKLLHPEIAVCWPHELNRLQARAQGCAPLGMKSAKDGWSWEDVEYAKQFRDALVENVPPEDLFCAQQGAATYLVGAAGDEEVRVSQPFVGFIPVLNVDTRYERSGTQSAVLRFESKGKEALQLLKSVSQLHPERGTPRYFQTDRFEEMLNRWRARYRWREEYPPPAWTGQMVWAWGNVFFFTDAFALVDCDFNPWGPGCQGKRGIQYVPFLSKHEWAKIQSRQDYILSQLTPEERAATELAIVGMSSLDIGAQLNISQVAVNRRVQMAHTKLGLRRNREHLTAFVHGIDFKDARPQSILVADKLQEVSQDHIDLLRLVAQGYTLKEIDAALKLNINAKHMVNTMYNKFQVEPRSMIGLILVMHERLLGEGI